MAEEAGIGQALWAPEELGIETAGQLVKPLGIGLAMLKNFPERYKIFNPANGWGDYGGLVEFVADYLVACRLYPDAKVRVSG
jgi:hypothetical protein